MVPDTNSWPRNDIERWMSSINLEQSKHIQKFPGTDWHGLPDEKEL
jgi:hypothetical protein